MATHHQITATFAFMEGERLGNGQPQFDFFGRQGEASEEDEEADFEAEDDAADADEPTAPSDPPRFSRCHEGEFARRRAAVEDRMQRMTDYTFASLLLGANSWHGT